MKFQTAGSISRRDLSGLNTNASNTEGPRDMTLNKQMLSAMFVVLFVLLLLLSTHALAQTPQRRRHNTPPRRTNVSEIQQLRVLVQSQQEQINQQSRQLSAIRMQLQQLVEASQQTAATAELARDGAGQAQGVADQARQTAGKAQSLVERTSSDSASVSAAVSSIEKRSQDVDKRTSALEDVLARFRFAGDIRVRGESFFQGHVPDRGRARLRVRFGIDGKLNEDFIGGIAIATGSLGDPTTTNESLMNFFDRKTIGLDRAYISYNPAAQKWLTLTAGKFTYTWNRTQVTGDPDINPEGFTEKASWDFNGPHLKNIAVHIIQTLFSESATGADSYAVGGQVAGRIQIGRLTTSPSLLALKWNNPDSILQASAFAVQATSTTGGTPVPGEGPGCSRGQGLPTAPPCAFAANAMTNATFNDVNGRPHFYSQYLYLDLIVNSQIKTNWSHLPINLLLEYQNNLDARSHPLDAAGLVRTDLGKQAHTYLVDVSLGQTRNKNDFQVGYAWLREEQDAAIASFAESDQRAPTNALQHRWYALWKVRANTLASYTFWYGRTLNSSLQHAVLATGVNPGQQEPYLKRMQFDLIYSF